MTDIEQQGLRPYRQGDVLLVPCATIPAGADEEMAENGRVVIARGERTGHAHTMAGDRACYFREDGTGSGYIRVAGPVAVDLTHEDHSPLKIPPGDYRVVQQREYQPLGEPQFVID